MLTFFLVLHFLIAVLLVFLIVIQKGDDDGALGISGGASSANAVFSPRGQANFLTKITSYLAAAFMINCIIIANIVSSDAKPKVVINHNVKK